MSSDEGAARRVRFLTALSDPAGSSDISEETEILMKNPLVNRWQLLSFATQPVTSLMRKMWSSQRQFQLMCQCGVAVLLVILVAGCSRRYHDVPAYFPIEFKDYENQSVGRFKTSYLVEQIDNYYRGANPGAIGITTFVNVDDLYTTSTFGRVLAEQVMSELSMKGFDVIELRHSDALHFLNPAGEFALSRDVAALRRERDLGGVVVGTYAVSPLRVYVNARLLDPTSSMVLSAGSVEMSKTSEIARLLRGGSVPATMERIPVRHLGISTFPAMGWGAPQYVSEEGPPRDSFAVDPRLAPPSKAEKRK